MSVCLCAFWECVPSCLAMGWTWGLATVAVLHPWGQEWPWARGIPLGDKAAAFGYLEPCTAAIHSLQQNNLMPRGVAQVRHTLLAAIFPELLSSYFIWQPQVHVSEERVKVGASLLSLRLSWKFMQAVLWESYQSVEGSTQNRALWEGCFLQQTAITAMAMVQMETASSCKTLSLWKMSSVTLRTLFGAF